MHSDVVICGGGLAGLCLARQLRRELPEVSVTVVEKAARPLPEATHKVGESSVELASHYFGEVLGLKSYLLDRQLIKNGLSFFPGGGDTLPVAERTEIGPPRLPVVPSYQLDRGRLENDLRAFVEADGATLIEGVGVQDILLSEDSLTAPHRVVTEDGRELTARWVVDASGRRRLLARKLKTTIPSGHHAHAAWFRVPGRLDIGQLVPESDTAWHRRDPDDIRWLSTTHLMGEGYWAWLIPLSSGMTSVGVVVHGSVHPFDTIKSLAATREWIAKHEPVLNERLHAFEVSDFIAYRDYSYASTQCMSRQRFSMVGEAGLFVDPFYSPGSDFIALANSFTVELIRADLAGEDLTERAEFTDWFYRRLAEISTLTYRVAAAAYGRPRVLAAKVYWDNTNYWSFLCQYFFQGMYRLPLAEQRALIPIAQRFATLNERGQRLLAGWARRAEDLPERRHVVMPPVPSLLATLHLDLEKAMTPDETRAYMAEKVDVTEELLTELLLRAITELGPTAGAALVRELEAEGWPLAGLDHRLAAEQGGRGRRKRLSRIARDVERTLGPAVPHPDHVDLEAAVRVTLRPATALAAPAE